MEVFKLISATDFTVFTEGSMIPQVDSIMWAERYRDPGEFEIKAKLSSGIREFLPIGTFISHTDTLEVMYVENHNIDEGENEDPTISITGRSLEAFLENRIIGTYWARGSSSVIEYGVVAEYLWIQIMKLINGHIGYANYPDDHLANVFATTNITGTGVSEKRVYKIGDVHKKVLELLEIEDLGIKNIRRNTFGAPDGSSTQTNMCVHKGVDRSASVVFSWKAGDIEGAEYLWSDKKLKNSAMVLGRYIFRMVDTPGYVKFNRRTMLVDGYDIDGNLNAPPTGTPLNDIYAKMLVRGQEAIATQNRVTITRTDLADISKYQYRKDFDVGDLISLDGNFGQIAKMRIIEYVEIQDENGESSHPTLSVPGVL